ncbi:pirin family protein [Rhodococcus sp. UNC363MFTsu5.1]|uniref:pirin family protein n=1 Tax=Rhodococcus sp. UNC363MFTsu5.1 TaxID=1449069 RepID=UPI000480E1D6|nr:pirin family protein [Rhodococcus sp. UNC363MFTsu5.1]
MSNLDPAPDELVCAGDEGRDGGPRLLDFRDVPLGGPRAMPVRRSLPQRAQSFIGAWCFLDHYGPDDVSTSGGMKVAGHPHTGLQTVSWLFTGEIEHRDTTGVHALVRPGEINLMTAGSGIAHSEFSTPQTSVLHGVQLWVALPDEHRFTAPAFEHYAPPVVDHDGVRVLVFLGTLFGQRSPVKTFSALLGAELTLPPGRSLQLDLEPGFEHGVLVDTGGATVGGVSAKPGQLVYLSPGATRMEVRASEDERTRILLLGGEPLGEEIVMWWNFIGRSHDEIVQFREDWQRERSDQAEATAGRYGPFPTQWRETIPAPILPNTRLKPRS